MRSKKQRLILLTLLGLSLNSLTSCVHNPPDSEVCLEIHPSKGWCTFTISDVEFYIDDEHPYDFKDGQGPKTWWQLRPQMIQVPAQTWARMKAYIIKVCKQTGKCDKSISSWQRRIERVDEQIVTK